MVTEKHIQKGKKKLHDLIDKDMENMLKEYGDASYIPEITQATYEVLQGEEDDPTWQDLNRHIEGEWDRLLALYYADGLRGENLLKAATLSGDCSGVDKEVACPPGNQDHLLPEVFGVAEKSKTPGRE